MLQQRAVCAKCTHPILHIPFVCESCEGSFCVDCFDDSGLPLCVGCMDAQRMYLHQRTTCYRCTTLVDEPTFCLCGGIFYTCMQHLSFCRSCNRGICNGCLEYCVGCGRRCEECFTSNCYDNMVKCNAACGRWVCILSKCHFQTWVASARCCKRCVLGSCTCPKGTLISKHCAYGGCVEYVCSTTHYRVCHRHELKPCVACNMTKPKLGDYFVLKRESCKDCYELCFLASLCLKRTPIIKDLIPIILKFAF